MLIKGDQQDAAESLAVNCGFECGNAILNFNLQVKEFDNSSDG